MFFKTFAQKQIEAKGNAYDYDMAKVKSEAAALRKSIRRAILRLKRYEQPEALEILQSAIED